MDKNQNILINEQNVSNNNEEIKSITSNSNTTTKPIEWSPENESILVEWTVDDRPVWPILND